MNSCPNRLGEWLWPGLVAAWVLAAPAVLIADDLTDAETLLDPTTGIYVGNADGSGMKRVTSSRAYEWHGSPSWSQDGKWIAFGAYRSRTGERSKDSQVFVVAAEGGQPRMLGEGVMPSFSPGGKRIVFSRQGQNHGVWVMSSEGPEQELVQLDERGWSAEWSPDGRKIVYAVRNEQNSTLVVLDLVEGMRTPLFDPATSPYVNLHWDFAWSPDSRRVAFKGKRADDSIEVGLVDARGAAHGLDIRLKEKVFAAFAWSPDGNRLLISKLDPQHNVAQLYQLNPDGTDMPQLLPGQKRGRANSECAYSPDGKSVAVASSPSFFTPQPDK